MADFAQCTNEGVLTESNIGQLGFNEHALIYTPENFTATGFTNVVYGSDSDLKCDHFTISDNAAYVVPREFKAAAISYDRQFKQGETTTLCLPFAMEVPPGAIAFTLESEEKDTLVFYRINGPIEANKPYVIVTDREVRFGTTVETIVPVTPNILPQVSINNYVMTGTLAYISGDDAEKQRLYTLGNDNNWTLGKQAISPYRAHLWTSVYSKPDSIPMKTILHDIIIADGDVTDFKNVPEYNVLELVYTRTLNNAWNALYVPFQIELTEEFLANYDVAYINDVRSYDSNEDGELDNWEMEIIKIKKLGKLLANLPYVIRPKNDEAKNLNITQYNTKLHSTAADKQISVTCSSAYMQYEIKGVYSKTVSSHLDNGNYVYAINKVGEWQKMGLETSLLPFRLYLTMKSKEGSPIEVNISAAQSIRMRVVGEEAENGATIIYDVEADEELKGENGKVKAVYDLQGRRVLEPKKGSLYIINNKKVIF